MVKEELDSFTEYAKEERKKRNYNFKLDMDALQSKNIRFLPLDETKDSQLPDWAARILSERAISKRVKLLLLSFHNERIRKHRLGIAYSVSEHNNE